MTGIAVGELKAYVPFQLGNRFNAMVSFRISFPPIFPIFPICGNSGVPKSWQILTPRLHRPSVAAVRSLVVSGIPSIEMRVALKEKEQPGEHGEFYSIYLSIYLKHGEFENWDEMG